ncbi:MAG: hypothetical protein QG635_1425 [Bacteroidota bacterium]|nr:hypothetical protein [Bacteroidota bacterium]
MDYTLLIHDFVDGTLDSRHEEGLFLAMASNDGLRTELKSFIEIEKAAKNDFAAFSPSANSTMNIFNRLGIEGPAAAVIPDGSGAAASALKPGLLGFLGKNAFGIFTNIATMVLTASVMYFGVMPALNKLNNSAESGIITRNVPVIRSDEGGGPTESPVNQSSISGTGNINIKPQKQIIIKYVERTTKAAEPIFENPVLAESPAIADIKDYPTAKPMSFNLSKLAAATPVYKPNTIELPSGAQYAEPLINMKNNEQYGFTLELKGSDYYSLQNETVPRSSYPVFANSGLTIMYNVNNMLAIGLDLRQEFFFQNYHGLVDDSLKYRYEQNTNYIGYGGTARLNLFSVESLNLGTFAQVVAGGNQVGIIGRAIVGLTFMPYKNFGFVLGVEGSNLWYYHGGEQFTSSKIGLNYGILFDF